MTRATRDDVGAALVTALVLVGVVVAVVVVWSLVVVLAAL